MNWAVCTDGPERIPKVWVNCPSKDHVTVCRQNEDRKRLALGLPACSNGLQSKENVEVVDN